MKIPPKKPHFLKPIQKGFKNDLKIPIGFLKYLKGNDQHEHAILRKAGKKWLVKVKCWRFEAGWTEFVEQHGLQLGDLLIFRHEGDMEFEVSIFDSRHCDREYAEYLLEGGGNNVEETSKNFKFKDKPNPNIVSSRKAFPKEESATHSSFGQSHFACTVRPYSLSRNFLWLPKEFAWGNGLVNRKCDLVIRDERQRSWNLRLDNYHYRVYIAKGWSKFCVDNDLKEGDCITFEVVTNGEKSIWKFHDLRRKTSDVMALISQIPASTSTDANPHFISTIKPYTFTNAILHLPMDFVKSNGLMSRSEMILVDEKQRSWSVLLGRTERHFGIKSGWSQFRKANGVQVGDTYKLELINNGTIPIVHYLRHKAADVTAPISQIPASTSTDANPHFIYTIKPYTFRNAILHLPMDFVKSNGLMSRSEMILVDEKQRSWSVLLGRMQHHFGIKRGWGQFRKANGVQVGDTYEFELTNNGTIPIVHCKFSGKDAKHHKIVV